MNYMDCVVDLADGACVRCRLPLRVGVKRNCVAVISSGANQPEMVQSPRVPQSTPSASGAGPGTELHAMLGRFGLTASGDCKCNSRASLMDTNGCDWCESNIDEIVGWLRESAAERGLPFLDAAGRMLVRRAIANARRKEQARAQEASQAEGPAEGGAA